MTRASLTCDEVEALLPLIADEQLDAASDPALFAHLADCPRCAESLATHDLITLALAPSAQSAAGASRPRLRFPVMAIARKWLPRAAAAVLLIALGVSYSSAWPSPAAPTVAAKKQPVVSAQAIPSAHAEATEPIQIDVEVVTVPGATPGHPRYLVRRGEQVMLVDPTAGPTEAVPATYAKPSAHDNVRRY